MCGTETHVGSRFVRELKRTGGAEDNAGATSPTSRTAMSPGVEARDSEGRRSTNPGPVGGRYARILLGQRGRCRCCEAWCLGCKEAERALKHFVPIAATSMDSRKGSLEDAYGTTRVPATSAIQRI
ncbi:hypothetical protein C8T65DRAFT_644877 [Cerioporus squamosus]|nr:hypothetical protein C8T65DRAFT_644877 [Cerioporus squamosus]